MVALIRENPIALTVVEPVSTYDVFDEIDELANDLWESESSDYETESIPMDMYELKDELVIRAELPGIKREDVDVSLEGQSLTITAEKKQPNVSDDAASYFCERCFGMICRSVLLPFMVDAKNIHTSFTDGVLAIRLPKSEEAKAKHIKINVGSSRR